MATFTLRRFSRPATLRQIAPASLLAFLKPHRRYFLQRGVEVPLTPQQGEINYDALATVFLSPTTKTPKDLVDAVYFIDEMATPEGMDVLLEEMQKRELKITGSALTPADVAVQIWLRDPELLERKHAESYIVKIRSFESYQMCRRPQKSFPLPSDKLLASLARDLDAVFEKKKRGRGSRVIACEREDGYWFLVRHGEPLKREESIDDGVSTSSVYYRPIKYDVVHYVRGTGELRINARAKWEKQLYRKEFGKHLFGDEESFPGTNKYTLDPLRNLGEDALATGAVEGLEWIRLQEVQLYYTGNSWELVTRKSNDFFALLKSRNARFPDGRLVKAKFLVKFTDSKTPRSVVIKPGNIAQYTRDDDSTAIDEWLQLRGFILDPLEMDEAQSESEHLEQAMAGH